MIMFIAGPVDWEAGPVDWRAEEKWGHWVLLLDIIIIIISVQTLVVT